MFALVARKEAYLALLIQCRKKPHPPQQDHYNPFGESHEPQNTAIQLHHLIQNHTAHRNHQLFCACSDHSTSRDH